MFKRIVASTLITIAIGFHTHSINIGPVHLHQPRPITDCSTVHGKRVC